MYWRDCQSHMKTLLIIEVILTNCKKNWKKFRPDFLSGFKLTTAYVVCIITMIDHVFISNLCSSNIWSSIYSLVLSVVTILCGNSSIEHVERTVFNLTTQLHLKYKETMLELGFTSVQKSPGKST